jgi:recombination protein RecR
VLARDVDFEHIEKTGIYNGYYFVLGGLVPILEKEPEKRARLYELKRRLESDSIGEIIIAMNANPDGENTEEVIREYVGKIAEDRQITISTLGRGLSTGVELEYSDSETLKHALSGRRVM